MFAEFFLHREIYAGLKTFTEGALDGRLLLGFGYDRLQFDWRNTFTEDELRQIYYQGDISLCQ